MPSPDSFIPPTDGESIALIAIILAAGFILAAFLEKK